MRWRSGPDGYGVLTTLLHWLTVVLVTGQFVVGYGLDLDDCGPACEAGADGVDLVGGSFDLAELHLLLGLAILTIAVVRPLWRPSVLRRML